MNSPWYDFFDSFYGQWPLAPAAPYPSKVKGYLEHHYEDLVNSDRISNRLILPRRLEDGAMEWCCTAWGDNQARWLRDEIRAFVDTSYVSFSGVGQRDFWRDKTAHTQVVGGGKEPYTFRFRVSSSLGERVFECLSVMQRLWVQRPQRKSLRFRSIPKILRDFELAIWQGDDSTARSCRDELAASGRFGADNLQFVNILYLASQQRWNQILDSSEFFPVVQARRPKRVTEELLNAFYHVHLKGFEASGDAAKAVETYREDLLPRFGRLFDTRRGIDGRTAQKALLVHAVARKSNSAVEAIVANFPEGRPDSEFVKSLASLVIDISQDVESEEQTATPQAEPDAVSIDSLIADFEFDLAWDESINLELSRKQVEYLLRLARDIATLDAYRETYEQYLRLDAEDQEFLRQHKRHYARLLEGVERNLADNAGKADSIATIPCNWLEWSKALLADPNWEAARSVAEQGASEWDVEAWLMQAGAAGELADALASFDGGPAEEQLQLCLPHLLRSLERAERVKPLGPVYSNLILKLMLADSLSPPELRTIDELVDRRLEVGIDPDDYSDLVSNLTECWQQQSSLPNLEWALDILDTLSAHTCRAPEARQIFFSQVLACFHRFSSRDLEDQWQVLESLAGEMGCSELVPEREQAPLIDAHDEVSPEIEFLRGKRIGIYTLSESAGRRAKTILEQRYAGLGLKVELSTAKGGTDTLKNMARTFDIMVVVWRSAKHAATEFIEAHRPKHLATLLPKGKGSASILREIRDYCTGAI